ncbi:MAG TPA: glucose-6-phosphate isomerase, partial [Bacilli bacterium]|nr:glucose-6-phosphate isomerase [Bacilli bacterium]
MLNYQQVLPFIKKTDLEALEPQALKAKEDLLHKTCLGNDFVGWVDYPNRLSEADLKAIVAASQTIQNQSQVLLVIGIGGSYLGAKSALSMLRAYFKKTGGLEILFVGNTLSSTYTKAVLQYLQHKDFSINVISKSGTTTEPAIAFRLFRGLLKEKYGSRFNERIYCTTTIGKGVLYSEAINNNYQIFAIPEDIGGRYSVLTPVGLLPMACSNIDIYQVINGASQAIFNFSQKPFWENQVLLYASLRKALYDQGKRIEMLVYYEPKLHYFGEWYKQLFGESEGKNHLGLFPVTANYSTDLHSLGQYVQDGHRHLFETVLNINKPEEDLTIPLDQLDFDQLNYLTKYSLHQINHQALVGTTMAHVDGGVPNILINVPELS